MLDFRKYPPIRWVADSFREVVSGAKDGQPDWSQSMAIGSDVGLFGPDSAVWQVHGNVATLVGGVRALLLQAAHPAALTGVAEHSSYEIDPLGRLERTTRWLTITSFGSTEAIAQEARRVNEMHKHVHGEFESKSGSRSRYEASNPRFLLWVHCAFTDSFLKAHLALNQSINKGADRYVQEWSASAIPLGLMDAPKSVSELEAALRDFEENELATINMTPPVVKFILKPPFGRSGLLFYTVIANAAISTLEKPYLRILGLRRKRRMWLKMAKLLLSILSLFLGQESPSQKIARERIAKL